MKTRKKIISVLLSLALIFSMAPAAFADDAPDPAPDFAAQFAALQEQIDRIVPRLPDVLPRSYQGDLNALETDIGTYNEKTGALADLVAQIGDKEAEVAQLNADKAAAYDAFSAYLANTRLSYASVLDTHTSEWSYVENSLKYIIENGYIISIKATILGNDTADSYTLLAPWEGDIADVDAVLAYLIGITESYTDGSLYANAFAAVTRPSFITDAHYTGDEWNALKDSVKDRYEAYFTELVADVVTEGPPLGNAVIAARDALEQAESELDGLLADKAGLEDEIAELEDTIADQIEAIQAYLNDPIAYLDSHTINVAITGTPDAFDLKPNASGNGTYVVTSDTSVPPVSALLKYSYLFAYDDPDGILSTVTYGAGNGKLTVKSVNTTLDSPVSAEVALSAQPKDYGAVASGRIVAGDLVTGTDYEYAVTYQIKPAGQIQQNEAWFIVIEPKTVAVTVWPKLAITSAKATYTFTVTEDNYVDQEITDFAATGGKPDYTWSFAFDEADAYSAGDARIVIDEDTGVITIPKDVNTTPYKSWDKGDVNKPYRLKVTVTDAKGDSVVKPISIYFRTWLDAQYTALLGEATDLAADLAIAKGKLEEYPDGYVEAALLDRVTTYADLETIVAAIWNNGNPAGDATKQDALALIGDEIAAAGQALEDANSALGNLADSALSALNDAKADLDAFIADADLTEFDSYGPYYAGLAAKLEAIKTASAVASIANPLVAAGVKADAFTAAQSSVSSTFTDLKALFLNIMTAKTLDNIYVPELGEGMALTALANAKVTDIDTNIVSASDIDNILSVIDAIISEEGVIPFLNYFLSLPL